MEGSGKSLGSRKERVDANGALAKVLSACGCTTELQPLTMKRGFETMS